MDVDRFLDIERRTGIKDSDIDGFLSKVDNVQDQLAKLMSGELAPADVKIPGERTKEEEGKFQSHFLVCILEWCLSIVSLMFVFSKLHFSNSNCSFIFFLSSVSFSLVAS